MSRNLEAVYGLVYTDANYVIGFPYGGIGVGRVRARKHVEIGSLIHTMLYHLSSRGTGERNRRGRRLALIRAGICLTTHNRARMGVPLEREK